VLLYVHRDRHAIVYSARRGASCCGLAIRAASSSWARISPRMILIADSIVTGPFHPSIGAHSTAPPAREVERNLSNLVAHFREGPAAGVSGLAYLAICRAFSARKSLKSFGESAAKCLGNSDKLYAVYSLFPPCNKGLRQPKLLGNACWRTPDSCRTATGTLRLLR
jgi:hypothetical protein